jgi:serine/threonine protein phosphatase PrpC
MNCSGCGTEVDAQAHFCESCGARIGGAVAAADASASPRDHHEIEISHLLAAVSDRGLRHAHNEDAVALSFDPPFAILVVCDGVSSSHDPARGSGAAAEATAGALRQGLAEGRDATELMHAAILAGHAAVCGLMSPATNGDERPLTTIVAALAGAGTATIGWAGDSRAYLLSRSGRLLTHDDSWVNWVVERGEMTEAQAMHSSNAHAIMQCLGDPQDPPEPHVVSTALSPGDRLLLCTDGLWNYAATPSALLVEMAGLSGPTAALVMCQALVNFANDSGGHDNITAAMLIVSGEPPDDQL